MKNIENSSIIVGNAFHRLMEFSMDLSNLKFYRAKKLLSDFALSSTNESLVLSSVEKILNSVKCSKLLAPDSDFILIESEWANENGDILRPDRVDFKLKKKLSMLLNLSGD